MLNQNVSEKHKIFCTYDDMMMYIWRQWFFSKDSSETWHWCNIFCL